MVDPNRRDERRFPVAPLIINGDDFGLSESVNRAIIEAHCDGVLTSASLMVNERAAGQAVALAREHPDLAVGLHLSLVLGRAALPPDLIPHLADASGEFATSPLEAGLRYYFSRSARRELRAEMRRQFDLFAATGLPFSHVDGHNHLHMHPVVFDQLLSLCEEYGVRRVRVVRGEVRLSLRLDRRRLLRQMLLGLIFNLLARRCERRLRHRGFIRPQRVYGFLQSGALNERRLLGLIEGMEDASAEIYAHPLAPDAPAGERRENPGGADELRALKSPRVRRAIDARGFRLVTYHALATELETV